MGIPYFVGTWLQKLPNVVQNHSARYISSFSIDLNAMMHPIAQQTFAYNANLEKMNEREKEQFYRRKEYVKTAKPEELEAEFHFALTSEMTSIISQVHPREILCIAVDGVAPQSKIAQQRQRRYKSAMDRTSVFDSNCISAGTEFMRKTNEHIHRWIDTQQRQLPPKIIYDSFERPGEGEHKILDYMRDGEITGAGAHVIYGLDADLIMLALLSPLEHMYLMRKDINDWINIDALKEYLEAQLQTVSAIDDFILLMFLLGNDFLPALPIFTDLAYSLDYLIDRYKELVAKGDFHGLSFHGDIKWEELSRLLKTVDEAYLLDHLSLKAPIYPLEALDQAFVYDENKFKVLDVDRFRDGWYDRALRPRTSSRIKFLDPEQNPALYSVSVEKVSEMVQLYIEGLQWIFRYYKQGLRNVNASYVYPYFFAPMLMDLIGILDIPYVPSAQEPLKEYHFSSLEQLLAILPLRSKSLLPKEVWPLLEWDSPMLDYFPYTFEIDRQGARDQHSGIVLIPFVDWRRIVRAVYSLDLASGFLRRYNEIPAPRIEIQSVRPEFSRSFLGSSRARGGERGSYRGRGESRGIYRGREESSYRGRGESSYRGREESSYRGREESTRGREESTRGREESTRGREESTRGRGESTRGRGESTRGRGESTRGRGESTRAKGKKVYREKKIDQSLESFQ